MKTNNRIFVGRWAEASPAHAGTPTEQSDHWAVWRDAVNVAPPGFELTTPGTQGKLITVWATAQIRSSLIEFLSSSSLECQRRFVQKVDPS